MVASVAMVTKITHTCMKYSNRLYLWNIQCTWDFRYLEKQILLPYWKNRQKYTRGTSDGKIVLEELIFLNKKRSQKIKDQVAKGDASSLSENPVTQVILCVGLHGYQKYSKVWHFERVYVSWYGWLYCSLMIAYRDGIVPGAN